MVKLMRNELLFMTNTGRCWNAAGNNEPS